MKKNMKRCLSIIIAVFMIISSLPIIASAATSVNDSSNLTLRWLASDNYLQDESTNSRTANKQGTVSWDNNNGYKSAKFSNGDIWYTVSSNIMSSGLASSVESGGAGTTFAFKAYVADNTSAGPFFCIFNNNYSSSGYKTLFSYAPNGSIVYTNSAGTAKYSSTSTVSNGWHTYVIRFYSSKSLEIYADGTRLYNEQSDFYDNHTFDVPNSLKVGVNRENTSYFNGCIRDFRIYNKAIDVNTVTNNINTIADEENYTIPTGGDTNFNSQITSSSIKVNFVQPQIGGVNIENVSGRNYYRNILYCSNSFVANTSKVKVNQNSTYGYIVMPSNTIVLYDGVTAPIIPIKASFDTESAETGGYSYSTFASIFLPSTPAFSLDNTWIGLNTENCNRTIGWPSNSGSTNQLGNTDVRSGNTCQVQSFYYEIGFKNGLVMNSLPSNNPKTSIPFRFNQTVNESSTVTSAGNIYYIDITNLKSEINAAKTQAYNVSSKYGIYSSSSYSNYCDKTLALLNFDITANLQTTLGCSNAVTRVNNAINTAISEYKTAYSNLKKKECADLQFIDGTTDTIIYEEGSTPTLPDSNVAVSNNDGTHSYLGWDQTGSTVIDEIKHITYTQTKTAAQNCMFTSEITQEKSCTRNEITKHTCLICRYTYNEIGEKLNHTIVYNDYGNGTHSGVCSRCHELSTQIFEEHTFSNYISNNNATCTANATETSVCDKCTAQNTREITDSALGHDYTATVINPTCTEAGYTKYTCSRCSDTYIDEYSYVDALNHSFVITEIVSANCITNGMFEYSCSNCDYSYNEYTDVAPNNHNDLVYARTVAPTQTEDGYDIYYCSNLCGYWEKRNIVVAEKSELFDSYLDAYNASLETIVNDFEPYTNASVSNYLDAVNQAKANGENAILNRNIYDLDNATKSIIEATALLRLKTISITILSDDNINTIDATYGENVNIKVSEYSKITKESNNQTVLLCYSNEDVSIMANNDINIYVSPVNEKAYSKQYIYLDNNGKTIDIKYDIEDWNINAPSIPFYSFDKWEIIENTNTKMILKAKYTI